MDVSLVRVVRLFPTLVVDNASEKILVQDLRCIFIHSAEQFLTFTNIGHGVQCKRHGRFQWQFLGNCGSIRHVFQTDHYTDTPWEHSTFVQRPKAGATFADEHGRIWNFLEIRKAHRVSWSSSLLKWDWKYIFHLSLFFFFLSFQLEHAWLLHPTYVFFIVYTDGIASRKFQDQKIGVSNVAALRLLDRVCISACLRLPNRGRNGVHLRVRRQRYFVQRPVDTY